MFEKILEKVLSQVAGEYLTGIDSKNLNIGIWSGNVVVENVGLRPEVLALLELPINLQFSNIGRLQLKVPWKSLGSSKVEVFLDGVYIVISPTESKNWSFKDYKGLQTKRELIEKYANECVKKVIQQAQEQAQSKQKADQDAGYLEKLTVKIIDNLQVHIQSIHVRYEDELVSKVPYSWGVCLNSIDIYTVDEQDRKIYLDRTLPENQEKPIRKVVQMSNLGIYWNAKQSNMISNLEKKIAIGELDRMILRDQDGPAQFNALQYVIAINFDAQLVQYEKSNQFDNPEIKLDINLQEINLKLENQQLQEIIQLAEFFTRFQMQLKDEKQIQKLAGEDVIRTYQQNFFQMFQKIQLNDQDKTDACLKPDEKKKYEEAILGLQIDDLCEIVLNVIVEIQKEIKLQQLENQKQNENQGFFSQIWGSSEQEQKQDLVSDEDRQNIDQFFSENFTEEALSMSSVIRPQDFDWFVLNFSLAGGSLMLVNEEKRRQAGKQDATKFSFNVLSGVVRLRDHGNYISVGLQSINLDMVSITKESGEGSSIRETITSQSIIKPNDLVKIDKYIDFQMYSKPLHLQHIDTVMNLKIASLRVDFDPIFIDQIIGFFNLNVQDEDLQSKTWEIVEDGIQTTQNSMKNSLVSAPLLALDVKMDAPLIIVPFDSQNPNTEVWVFSLGDIIVKTGAALLKPGISDKEQAFDLYDVSIVNIGFSYYRNMEIFTNQYEQKNESLSPQVLQSLTHYTLIQQFDLILNAAVQKGVYESLVVGESKIKVNGELPKLELRLCPLIYSKLLQMGDCFAVPKEEYDGLEEKNEILEQPPTDKRVLIKKQQKIGIMWRITEENEFEKCNAILCGDYLYFFSQPQSMIADYYLFVQNSKITPVPEEQCNIKNCFHLVNQYVDTYLATDTPTNFEPWITAILKKQTDNKIDADQVLAEAEKEKVPEVKHEPDFKAVNLDIQFKISTLSLRLQDNDNLSSVAQMWWLQFSTQNLVATFVQRSHDFEASAILSGLFLEDKLYKHKDSSLDMFITSIDPDSKELKKSDNLIDIRVISLDQDHPNYQKVGMHIDAKLGTLIINFKPDVLVKVLSFFVPQTPKQDTQHNQKNNQKSKAAKRSFNNPSQYGQGADEQREQDKLMVSGSVSMIEPTKPTTTNPSTMSPPKQNISGSTIHDNQSQKTEQQNQKIPFQKIFQDKSEIVNMEARIILDTIQIKMVHRQLHMSIASLGISNIDFWFKSYEDEMFLEGNLGNLQLIDLTNYPYTVYDEQQFDTIRPNEILGILPEAKTSLLYLMFQSFPEDSKKIDQNNTTARLKVKLSSIQINYMMQPVMRILDYVLVQILGPLGDREDFQEDSIILDSLSEQMIQLNQSRIDQNQILAGESRISQPDSQSIISTSNKLDDSQRPNSSILGNQKLNIPDPLEPLRKLGYEAVQKILANPAIMDMDIVIQNPLIFLQPNPGEDEYLMVNLGLITIYNERTKQESRLIDNAGSDIKAVYAQNFLIMLRDMEIALIRGSGNPVVKMSEPCDFNMQIEMPGFVNEYEFLYGPNFALDQSLIMSCYMSPLILRLSNKDYCLIMRCLFHNITYDDGCDQFMLHDFWKNFDQTVAGLEKKKNDEENKVVEIDIKKNNSKNGLIFQLDIENLSIFANENLKIAPFARVSLSMTRIIFQQTETEALVTVLGASLQGSAFEQQIDVQQGGKIYKQYNLLGQNVASGKYTQKQIEDLHHLVQDFKIALPQQDRILPKKNHVFGTFPFEIQNFLSKEECELVYLMVMQPSGEKKMDIDVKELRVMALMNPIMKLTTFALMDESVNPPPSVLKPITIPEELLVKLNNQLIINVNVDNLIIATPTVSQKNDILAIQGNIFFGMASYTPLSIENYVAEIQQEKQKLAEKMEENQEEEKEIKIENEFEINNIGKMTILVRDLQIFICNMDDLKKNILQKLKKENDEISNMSSRITRKKKENILKDVNQREILLPLYIDFNNYNYLALTTDKKNFRPVGQMDIVVKEIEFRISFKDLVLIEQTTNQVLSQMPQKSEQELKKEEELKQTQQIEKQIRLYEENQKQREEFFDRDSQSRSSSMLSEGEDNIDFLRELNEQDLELKMNLQKIQQKEEKDLIQSQIKIVLGNLQVMVINDVGDAFAPLIQLSLDESEVLIEQSDAFSHINTSIGLFVQYFNPTVSRWEPVIQSVGFNIDIVSSPLSNIKSAILVEMNEKSQSLTINASTQFVKILMSTLQLYKASRNPEEQDRLDQLRRMSVTDLGSFAGQLESSDQVGDDVITHVSPYTIVNQTGYSIQVYKDNFGGDQSVIEEEGKQTSITIKNDSSACFPVNMQIDKVVGNVGILHVDKNRVNVKILPSKQVPSKDENQYDPVENLSLDLIVSSKKQVQNQFQKDIFISHTLQLDVPTNRKILVLSSTTVFVNQTGQKITVRLEDPKTQVAITLNLAPNKQRSIPIDFLNPTVLFGFHKENLTSKPIHLEQILKQLTTTNCHEVKLGSKFMELRIIPDPENFTQTLINIEPPIRIQNSLPKPLSFQILSRTHKTQITQTIKVGEVFQEFDHSLENEHKNECYIRINLPGFFWSDEIELTKVPKTQDGQQKKKHQSLSTVSMCDIHGTQSKFQVHECSSISTRSLYFYSRGYLLNQTPFDFLVYTIDPSHRKIKHMVSGQSPIEFDENLDNNLLVFGDESQSEKDESKSENFLKLLALSDRKNQDKISQQCSIAGVGTTEVDVPIMDHGIEQSVTIGVEISINSIDSVEYLYSKVIILTPRYILVNQCDEDIIIRQKGEERDSEYVFLKPNERRPLIWSIPSKQKFIELNTGNHDLQLQWNWSKELDLSALGVVNFWLRSPNNKQFLFLQADTREQGSNMFIIIEKVKENQYPYKIENNTVKTKLEFPVFPLSLPPGEAFYFSWDEPCKEVKIVETKVIHLDGSYTDYTFDVHPDRVNAGWKLSLQSLVKQKSKQKGSNDHYVKCRILLDGYTKVIRFEDSHKKEAVTQEELQQAQSAQKLKEKKNKKKEERDRKKKEITLETNQVDEQKDKDQKPQKEENQNEEENQNDEGGQLEVDDAIINQQIKVSLKAIGISIVVNSLKNSKPQELLYLEMRNIEFGTVNQDKINSIQLRVQYINIDHNAQYFLQHPVIFTPQKYEAYNQKDPKKESKYFLNFLVEQNLSVKNIILYSKLVFEIDPITVKVEQVFTENLISFVNALQEALGDNSQKDILNMYDDEQEDSKIVKNGLNEEAKDNQSVLIIKNRFPWLKSELPLPSPPTYIDQFILSPLQVNLTFQMKPKSQQEENLGAAMLIKTITNALGVVLANIDDAPIALRGIKLDNCFDSTAGITRKIIQKYQKEAIIEVFKILGSLNFIGNPVGLFQNISSGVNDLIDKPIEGFVKGPLQGSLGVIKGAGSLVKNTISGAFNSVNKITGSVSSGLSALCMDDDYLASREKMKSKKAKHLGDGLAQGAVSIFQGFEQGITGIFLKPFEGAQKDGVQGFFKGAFQGIAGLVIKPVTGILDGVGKAADGIKNTALLFDDKPNENRLRAPRVFYGKELYFKEYIHLDAEILTALQLIQKGAFKDDPFFSSCMILSVEENKEVQYCLVLTFNVLIYLSFKSEKPHKPLWIFQYEEISQIENVDKGIKFKLDKDNKYLEKINKKILRETFIPFSDQDQQQGVYQLVVQLYEASKKYTNQDKLIRRSISFKPPKQ